MREKHKSTKKPKQKFVQMISILSNSQFRTSVAVVILKLAPCARYEVNKIRDFDQSKCRIFLNELAALPVDKFKLNDKQKLLFKLFFDFLILRSDL